VRTSNYPFFWFQHQFIELAAEEKKERPLTVFFGGSGGIIR
jgi:hypothetical protein